MEVCNALISYGEVIELGSGANYMIRVEPADDSPGRVRLHVDMVPPPQMMDEVTARVLALCEQVKAARTQKEAAST